MNISWNYSDDSNEGYFIESDVQYPENLHNFHNDFPFFPERMEFKKAEKHVANLHDEHIIHIRNWKQALNYGLVLKKVHRVIKFNQKAWIKSYIDMITELRINATNDFEKDFFKLMNNAVFEKTMENVRKHRDIKFVTTEARRNYLVSKPSYHTTKIFLKIY